MLRSLSRFLIALLLVVLPLGSVSAEKVADLPVPTTYVNDFAQVLSPLAHRRLEDLCVEVHQQADAELFVVTIKSLDDGESKEQFTADLVEKWKIGKKGEDRSALLLLVVNPRQTRIEVGYGLEGILNDAKVGRILDAGKPYSVPGQYDQEMLVQLQGLADVIAADKGVALTPIAHTYRRQQAPQKIGPVQIVLGIGFVILILILIRTGHLGWAIWLILNLMGGGGGGGGREDRGGGFGGSGGGGSGGGGASRDF